MGDTSSWLPEEVLGAAREAPEAERDAPEDWDVPGLVLREDMAEEASDATDEGQSEAAGLEDKKASEDAPVPVATAGEQGVSPARTAGEIGEVRSDVHVLQAEVEDILARLSAAAARTAERRQRSAQELEKLAAGVREEMADARDRVQALMSDRDELRKAQETFDRRQRKVLRAFGKRLEAVEAGISTLIADAESTHELLSALSQRRGAEAEPEVRSGPVSLNTATFEDLRSLGLSAAQAIRALSYRDAHGFDSVEQITELPGLPDELSQSLKARLTV